MYPRKFSLLFVSNIIDEIELLGNSSTRVFCMLWEGEVGNRGGGNARVKGREDLRGCGRREGGMGDCQGGGNREK